MFFSKSCHSVMILKSNWVYHKENINKLAIFNAVYALPNQHQINVNVRLPPWLEIVKLATPGIPRGVHVDYRLSADAGSM